MLAKASLTILLIALTLDICAAQQTRPLRPDTKGQTPLSFEENHGQTDRQVSFLSRGKGYTAYLSASGIVLSLRTHRSAIDQMESDSRMAEKRNSPHSPLEFKLVGSNPNITGIGEDPQPGLVNYFFGKDPSRWLTNIHTYGRVRYLNVYRGIDLLYYGNHRQLEYDFIISPHTDPGRIEFDIRGAKQIRLGSEGNLILTVADGELALRRPTVYQESNGLRIPLAGEYVIKDATHIGFRIPSFDPDKPLVIDPVLIYASYLGGSGDDQPNAIAVDSNGAIYVAGYSDSTDFPLATLGSLPPGVVHVFLSKFDASGSTLLYTDFIGGNGADLGYALAVDNANNVYVTGITSSTDFPVLKAYQSSLLGSFNTFLTEVASDGSSLLYSTYLGGNGSDVPSGLQLDHASNIVVAGTTTSTDFPVINAYQPAALPNQGGYYGSYGFVTKFSSDGSSLVYSTYLAGNTNIPFNCGISQCWTEPSSYIYGLALDGSGSAYIAGTTNTYNFPVSSGAYLPVNSTFSNATVSFVAKLDTSGTLAYSTYFYEPSGFTTVQAIAVDTSEDAYVTGRADSNGTFPVTSTTICDPNTNGAACGYAFVSKFDATASTLLYSTFLGPNNYAYPVAIALDSSNDAYVFSTTSSSSFQTVNGIQPYAGGNDLLLVEIDPNATSELFATYLGGSSDDIASGMAIDSGANVYLTGSTYSSDYPVTQQAFQSQLAGNSDAFVVKIGPPSFPAVSLNPSSLTFADEQVGVTSVARQIVVSNSGTATLAISSIAVAGDFAQTNDCGDSVSASGKCTIQVTFDPSGMGQRNGSVTITDDAAGSPHTVVLGGVGLSAVASISPTALGFATVALGTSSSSQAVTISNQGNANLTISNLQLAGDFKQTNNCSSTLSAGSSCTVTIGFTPTAAGSRSGSLTVSDNSSGSPQSVSLSGVGADFSISGSPNKIAVTAGGTATADLKVTSTGGVFPSLVQLNCSGQPVSSTCNISPASLTLGATSVSATLTIATSGGSAKVTPPSSPFWTSGSWLQMSLLGLVSVALIGAFARRRELSVALSIVTIGLVVITCSCAGGTGVISRGGKGGTAPGTYTITVTAVSGNLQHSLPLTLTVQ